VQPAGDEQSQGNQLTEAERRRSTQGAHVAPIAHLLRKKVMFILERLKALSSHLMKWLEADNRSIAPQTTAAKTFEQNRAMVPEVRCAWHGQNFPRESNVIKPGRIVLDEFGNQYEPMISHSLCCRCLEIFKAENNLAIETEQAA
jgi:hypothetical protein